MTTSGTTAAQDVVKCQCDLCDLFEDVNSFCRECSFYICDKCKKSHLRLNTNHTVVPAFEGFLERRYTVSCSNHGDKFIFFCTKCRKNVCVECITSDHKGHVFEKVDEHASKLKEHFTYELDSQKTKITKIREHLDSITQHKQDVKAQAKNLVDTIRSEANVKRGLLDEEEEKLIEIVNEEEKSALTKLEAGYKDIHDMNIQLNDLIESVTNELSRVPDAALLEFVHDKGTKLGTNLGNLKVDLPNLPVFTPPSITEESYILGSLKSLPSTPLKLEFEMRTDRLFDALGTTPVDPYIELTNPSTASLLQDLDVIQKFRPTGSIVLSISATDDHMLWVGTIDPLLVLLDENGKEKNRVEMPGTPYYTCINRRSEVIVSTYGKFIYKVTNQGIVSTFVDVSPGEVSGVTATQEGDVFACIKSGSVCKIQSFSSDGKLMLELDTRLFTSCRQGRVHAVCSDIICVQDGFPGKDDDCSLLMLTATGQVISRVKRTGELSKHTSAIVWDKQGNMLTGTARSEYIHVFSGEGVLRKSYRVGGSKQVKTLCLGRNGIVRIGTWEGEVITAKYLDLHSN